MVGGSVYYWTESASCGLFLNVITLAIKCNKSTVCNSVHVKKQFFQIVLKYNFVALTGQLTLKIPWKNLYTEPTVAILDGLYVVAVPSAGRY